MKMYGMNNIEFIKLLLKTDLFVVSVAVCTSDCVT
jgi:hypothetical protein